MKLTLGNEIRPTSLRRGTCCVLARWKKCSKLSTAELYVRQKVPSAFVLRMVRMGLFSFVRERERERELRKCLLRRGGNVRSFPRASQEARSSVIVSHFLYLRSENVMETLCWCRFYGPAAMFAVMVRTLWRQHQVQDSSTKTRAKIWAVAHFVTGCRKNAWPDQTNGGWCRHIANGAMHDMNVADSSKYIG